MAETSTIIISTESLKIPLRDRIWIFDDSRYAEWEQQCNVIPKVVELEGGVGKKWTKAEKEVGEKTRKVGRIDPSPQTVYRLKLKQKNEVFFSIPLFLARDSRDTLTTLTEAGGKFVENSAALFIPTIR